METQTIKERVEAGIKDAMRAKNKERLSILRSMLAKITEGEKELTPPRLLDVEETAKLLTKMTKQRTEAAETYRQQNRPELAEVEEFQNTVIAEFLPQKFDEARTRELITGLMEAGATDISKVMAGLRPYGSQVDSRLASTLAKELLPPPPAKEKK